MGYLGGYSAEMYDLLKGSEQKRLERFSSLVLTSAEKGVRMQRETPVLSGSSFIYTPGVVEMPVRTGKTVLILTDDDGNSPNLTAMTSRLKNSFSGAVQVINLRELDIRGGCLGCCSCAYDNTCVYTDGYVDFFKNTLQPADTIIMSGAVRDRYLSSVWKQFFDRSFFKGHTPGLKGKQIGFLISGQLRQIPCLKEALAGWADNGGCNARFLTDEVTGSTELDTLLETFAEQLVQGADLGYVPPPTFYAVGGHKLFRDSIYGGMRFVFQADYRYYVRHGMFDFPQRDLKNRLFNLVMMQATRIPAFRKQAFKDLKLHMVSPFSAVLPQINEGRGQKD
jgi:multimeric flavodoxin WrbA